MVFSTLAKIVSSLVSLYMILCICSNIFLLDILRLPIQMGQAYCWSNGSVFSNLFRGFLFPHVRLSILVL